MAMEGAESRNYIAMTLSWIAYLNHLFFYLRFRSLANKILTETLPHIPYVCKPNRDFEGDKNRLKGYLIEP